MSVVGTRCLFVRAPGVLWRDTGLHVLVMPRHQVGDVVVLGGGNAVLWRLLAEPLDLAGVTEHLAAISAHTPDHDTVESCVEDLLGRGVLSRLTEEDEL